MAHSMYLEASLSLGYEIKTQASDSRGEAFCLCWGDIAQQLGKNYCRFVDLMSSDPTRE